MIGRRERERERFLIGMRERVLIVIREGVMIGIREGVLVGMREVSDRYERAASDLG